MLSWESSSEIIFGKRKGQQLVKAIDLDALGRAENDLKVRAAKFSHDLAANAAGSAQLAHFSIAAARNGDHSEITLALANGGEKGGALSTVDGAVSGVFDITAQIHLARFGQERGSDGEMGLGGIGA